MPLQLKRGRIQHFNLSSNGRHLREDGVLREVSGAGDSEPAVPDQQPEVLRGAAHVEVQPGQVVRHENSAGKPEDTGRRSIAEPKPQLRDDPRAAAAAAERDRPPNARVPKELSAEDALAAAAVSGAAAFEVAVRAAGFAKVIISIEANSQNESTSGDLHCLIRSLNSEP